MNKITNYEQIIITELVKYANSWNNNDSTVRTQTIIDTKGKHYQLIRLGWKTISDYVHYCVFHIDIIEGKVWIQENRTDILIAEQLVNNGINKKDIVLGLLPHHIRKDTEYATA